MPLFGTSAKTGSHPAWRAVARGLGLFVRASLPATPVGLAFLAISAAFVALVAIYDPFGLGARTETALQGAADRVMERVLSPKRSDDIALITPIRDDVTRGLTRTPIPYGQLAQIVDLAAAANASVLFLDYEFTIPVDPDDCPKTADQIGDNCYLQFLQAVKDAATGGVQVVTGPIQPGIGFDALKPLVQEADVRRNVGHPADYNVSGGRPKGPLSPAAALYLAHCRSPHWDERGCDKTLMQEISRGVGLPVLALQIGSAIPRDQQLYSDPREMARCRDASLAERILTGVRNEPLSDPCPHYLTVSLGEAINPSQFGSLRRDLQGRVVIVGQGWRLGDDHPWPGVGVLPGVVFHAAALDNLLTWNTAYWRWPIPFPFLGQLGPDDVVQFCLIVLMPLLVLGVMRCWLGAREDSRLAEDLPSPAHNPLGIALRGLLILAATVAATTLTALVIFMGMRWPPASSLVVLLVGLPITITICGEELARKMEPLNNRWTAAAMLTAFVSAVSFVLFPPLAAIVIAAVLLTAFAASVIWRLQAGRETKSPGWLTNFLAHTLKIRGAAR
jgi:hypothetical protein